MVDSSHTLIRCPDGMKFWQANDFSVTSIFVRKCYCDLFDAILASAESVCAIEGTSGIGKSTFVWYALIRRVAQIADGEDKSTPRHFIWARQDESVYWFSTTGECKEIIDRAYPSLPVDMCFIDISDRTASDGLESHLANEATSAAKVVLLGSPTTAEIGLDRLSNRSSLTPGFTYVMPTWSWEETKMAVSATLTITRSGPAAPDLANSELRLRAFYFLFGGALHFLDEYIWGSAGTTSSSVMYNNAIEDCVDILARQNEHNLPPDGASAHDDVSAGFFANIVRSILSETKVVLKFAKLVTKLDKRTPKGIASAGSVLLHVPSDGDLSGTSQRGLPRIASLFCEQFLTRLVDEKKEQDRQDLKQIFKEVGQSTYGGLFEAHVHHILASLSAGKRVFNGYLLRHDQTSEEFKVTLPLLQSGVKLVYRADQIGTLPEGDYARLFNINCAVIDFVIQLNVIGKITVGVEHELPPHKRHLLEEIRGQLIERDKNKHVFIWIVPPENFTRFPFQPGHYTGSDNASCSIRQFVLCIDVTTRDTWDSV